MRGTGRSGASWLLARVHEKAWEEEDWERAEGGRLKEARARQPMSYSQLLQIGAAPTEARGMGGRYRLFISPDGPPPRLSLGSVVPGRAGVGNIMLFRARIFCGQQKAACTRAGRLH